MVIEKIMPSLVTMALFLVLAHFYFQPEDIPPKILGIIFGGTFAVIAMLLVPRIIPVLLTIAAATILARAVLDSPPQKIYAGFGAIFIFAFIARRMEIGIISVLIICASIMYESIIPRPFTFGGMGFGVAEGLISFMLVAAIFEIGSKRELYKLKTPIALFIMLLFASIIMSFIVGYSDYLANPGSSWTFANAYNSLRRMYLYNLFFVILLGIRNKKQLKTIIITALIVAVIVSLLMVVQYFLGTKTKVFLGSADSGPRVEDLSSDESGVTRSLPPGLALIYMLFPIAIYLACVEKNQKNIKRFSAAAFILSMGLTFSFTRSQWSTMLFSLMLMLILSDRFVKKRLMRAAIILPVIALIASTSIATLAPGSAGSKFSKALSGRFLSTFQEKTMHSSSLTDRFKENRNAIRRIKERPFFGIGAGTPLRYLPGMSYKGTVFVPIYQMHNSYLELWATCGLPGILSFLGLSIVFLIRCYLLFRKAQDPFIKAIAIGSLTSYIGFLLKSAVTMMIMHESFSIVSAAFMFGIVEVAWRLEKEESLPIQLPDKAGEFSKAPSLTGRSH